MKTLDELIIELERAPAGRRVLVRADDGEMLEFVLSPATARFVSATGPHGPRLELLDER